MGTKSTWPIAAVIAASVHAAAGGLISLSSPLTELPAAALRDPDVFALLIKDPAPDPEPLTPAPDTSAAQAHESDSSPRAKADPDRLAEQFRGLDPRAKLSELVRAGQLLSATPAEVRSLSRRIAGAMRSGMDQVHGGEATISGWASRLPRATAAASSNAARGSAGSPATGDPGAPGSASSDSEVAASPAAAPSAGSATGAGIGTGPAPAADNRPPNYPAQAAHARLEGVVIVRLLIGADGSVREAAVYRSAGSPLLDDAAVTAVRAWRFTPATDDRGTNMACEARLPVEFRMRVR